MKIGVTAAVCGLAMAAVPASAAAHPLDWGCCYSHLDTHHAHADVVRGTGQRDYLRTRGGNDALYGRGGPDYLQGDSGADFLNGGKGRDLCIVQGPDTLHSCEDVGGIG